MKVYWLIVTLLGLVGCQTLSGDDIPATIEAERVAFATEVVQLDRNIGQMRAGAVVTIQAYETAAAQIDNVNTVLVATVRAGQPPEPTRIVGVFDETSTMSEMAMDDSGSTNLANSTGNMSFTQLAMASGVRNSDGCATGAQNQFSTNIDRVYLTAAVLNLQQGTHFVVEWRASDVLVDRSEWVADRSASSLCIWAYTDGPLSVGDWTATLYANGQMIEPVLSFTVTDP
jgi:hypothetical protein